MGRGGSVPRQYHPRLYVIPRCPILDSVRPGTYPTNVIVHFQLLVFSRGGPRIGHFAIGLRELLPSSNRRVRGGRVDVGARRG